MGIINESAVFMCKARSDGVSFRKTLTLGRQHLYVDDKTLKEIARQFNIPQSALPEAKSSFSEQFFKRVLMAEEVKSLDYSSYEGAGISHDLNLPIPANLEQQYDAVIDGGTLEHIFNFPVAISNCMRMVKTGGRLFIFTPANNQMGHGFYQFGPELFFRTFCASNGFEIERMIAVEFKYMATEFGSFKQQYEVKDPDQIKERVTLGNSYPVGLMIQARKTSHKSHLFQEHPKQSDYQRVWDGSLQGKGVLAEKSGGFISLLRRVGKRLPQSIRGILALQYHKYFTHSFRNRASYLPLRNRT